MKTKKTKKPEFDPAKEIAEFKCSGIFQTLTAAEQDRAIQEINQYAKAREREFARPLWKNFFADEHSAREMFVFEGIWLNAQTGRDKTKIQDGDHPLVSGYGIPGSLALAAAFDEGEDKLECTLGDIDRYFLAEMAAGNPQTAADLTPKQIAILELEQELLFLKEHIRRGFYNSGTVSTALTFGAALMRLAIVFPDGNHTVLLNMIAELPRLFAREVKKRAATRDTAGKPARYTPKKMEQAFNRMHPLINNTGLSQLAAAEKVIKRMGLTIGEPYLVQCYRDWLPTRMLRK